MALRRTYSKESSFGFLHDPVQSVFFEFSKKCVDFSFRATDFILGEYYSDWEGKVYGLGREI